MFQNNTVFCAQGALRGKAVGNGVTAFLGVPFAKPPVGPLRWRAPEAPSPWRGVRSAEIYEAGPLQSWGRMTDGVESAYLSEDCLYLNLWTPASGPEEKLPVYVWFYGGAYQAGNACDPSLDGTALAGDGVITVTVNYRVNLFGFLCHPDMRAESACGAGGNFGVLDQVAALQWVRENIAAFGGDPARVTIGGQSAGSASVNSMLCSPFARGLFAGAINESGDVFQPERDIPFEQAAEDGVRLGELLGCASLDALRALPAETFCRLNFDIMSSQLHATCTPVIDGVVIPYSQGNMLLRNDCMPVPILLGSNRDEGSGGGPGYVETVSRRLGVDLSCYPEEEPARTRALARDYWYARHLAWARIRTEEYGLPLWQYVFARANGPMGAGHGAEIPYIFRTIGRPGAGFGAAYGDEDYAFSKRVSAYWVNFIKNGDPNGEGLPFWPKKAAGVGHMRLDLTPEMEQDNTRPEDAVLCPPTYAWLKRRADGLIDA